MKINTNEALDYEDVRIVPRLSDIASRADVDTSGTSFIFASNMDGVGTIEMARALAPFNISTVLHKYHTAEEIIHSELPGHTTWCSIGMSTTDLETYREIYKAGLGYGLCIDVANGYLKQFHEFVSLARSLFPHARIMAGNVCTPEGVRALEKAGAEYIKIGVGPGAVCTTRLQTGVGIPQLTAVYECAKASKKVKIIADGGVQCPGDVAIAMAAGASGVMIGSLLSGYYEGQNSLARFQIDRGMECDSVRFYGMSSHAAQEVHQGEVKNYRASEGREVNVPYKGKVESFAKELLGGVRSACTYVGAKNPFELKDKATLRVVRRNVNRSFEQFSK